MKSWLSDGLSHLLPASSDGSAWSSWKVIFSVDRRHDSTTFTHKNKANRNIHLLKLYSETESWQIFNKTWTGSRAGVSPCTLASLRSVFLTY